jgi:predicted permease
MPNLGIPLAFNLHTDARILFFVFGVVLAVTLACGLFPLRQSFRISQNEALHAGGAAVAGRTRNRLGQRILLGLQLGICFVVLVCCGLFTRTALNIFSRDPGFNRANCLTAGINLTRSGYTKARAAAFQTALLDRLRNTPGVTGVTITSHLPMGDQNSGNAQAFSIPGYVPKQGEDMAVVTDFEGPDFFRTMGIPMDEGRDFLVSDNADAPRVAIVNQVMARQYWPQGDAIGHFVEVGKRQWQIVGIVHEYIYHSPDDTDPSPLLFLPLVQYDDSRSIFVAIRSRTSTEAVAGQLRRVVAALDPALPLENVRTLDEVAGDLYQFSRIPAELIGVYALASLLVAMAGLYAVMAYSVIERCREFALRMALGSTRAGVFRLILGGSAAIAGFGLVAGGLVSIAAVRFLRSMLFGVAPFDPVSYLAATALLLLTAVVSGLVPARRAASIQPMEALRTE